MLKFIYKKQSIEYFKFGSGKPIVLLLGMNGILDEWYEFIKLLKHEYKIYVFYRPGIGYGEVEDSKISIKNTSMMLDEFIKQKNIEKAPLIGHSYGGLCIQVYVSRYKSKNSIILIDSTSVDYKQLDVIDENNTSNQNSDDAWLNYCKEKSMMTHIQLKGKINLKINERNASMFPNFYRVLYFETKNWSQDATNLKESFITINNPLLVIGRDKNFTIKENIKSNDMTEDNAKKFEEIWHNLILNQSKLSSNSIVKFINKSNHNIHISNPLELSYEINMFLSENYK
ncbi:alpha/beta fold hydrolase [Macrococcus epidermidis]|uniref:alpha/beta fold hydrolase n=1 Tax=Macrococcus epidermidis TaxID=1902580 RepID=UPI0020B78748|nr:alpha/beta fold hydrolase [Macrococcus epidermidis]UTH15266.1 alpha/beta fold hydrolase [Macrococcus epidermidis]